MDVEQKISTPPQNAGAKSLSPQILLLLLILGCALLIGGFFLLLRSPEGEITESNVISDPIQDQPAPEISEEEKERIRGEIVEPAPPTPSESQKQNILKGLEG